MEVSQQVSLRPVPWSHEAAQLLNGAAGVDPTYTMDDLEREIQTGVATLYSVERGQSRLGYIVLWVENFGGTKELVIQSGKAFARERWAVKETLPVIEAFARANGCKSMRAHSSDSPMIGHLKRYGFRKTEIVLKKSWG